MRAQAAAFPLSEATGYVTTVKDGRVIRIELCQYPNIDAAQRAAGLRELSGVAGESETGL